ncbi:hypothetical protein BpHYR1_030234 [Brachionus plicatilis]|uniref:Uncharacterized protein n=1 Tax=Brachionus plicatilis TaxID=10195 RepID=A0A3M7SLE1_BRAPC|nr:hypothetical protein BpHYR1_030234 [Brachionus plicatilis]
MINLYVILHLVIEIKCCCSLNNFIIFSGARLVFCIKTDLGKSHQRSKLLYNSQLFLFGVVYFYSLILRTNVQQDWRMQESMKTLKLIRIIVEIFSYS